ncbi:MAG: hypothetical protein E7316_11175 [Clostridiales bacterium]|nr:hypothetical protein [Clostridiales bacterium]
MLTYVQCPHCKGTVSIEEGAEGYCPYCQGHITTVPAEPEAPKAPEEPVAVEEAGESKPSRKLNVRLLVCIILFGVAAVWGIVASIVSMVSTGYYGIYWMIRKIFAIVEILVLAAGSVLVFIFDDKGKKKAAVVTAIITFGVFFTLGVFKAVFARVGIANLLGSQLYPALLLTFALFNQRIRKFSLLWIVGVLTAAFLMMDIPFLMIVACCVGYAKYFEWSMVVTAWRWVWGKLRKLSLYDWVKIFACVVILLGLAYPVPNKEVYVSGYRTTPWVTNRGVEYVGGDAYNYQIEATLKAGYMAGVLAMKSITFVGGALLLFLAWTAEKKNAQLQEQTALLRELRDSHAPALPEGENGDRAAM